MGPQGPQGETPDISAIERALVSDINKFKDHLQKQVSAKLQAIGAAAGGGGSAGSGSYSIMDQRDVVFKQRTELLNNSILMFDTSVNKYVAKTPNEIGLDVWDPVFVTTDSYAATANNSHIFVNNDARTEIVLNEDVLVGKKYVVKDTSGNASINPITIRSENYTIDGEDFVEMAINHGALHLVYTGDNNWSII